MLKNLAIAIFFIFHIFVRPGVLKVRPDLCVRNVFVKNPAGCLAESAH